jgi:hypothetical protein
MPNLTIDTTVDIDARRDAVWDVLTDFRQLQRVRYAVAVARYETRSGGHAHAWATAALEIARDQTPQLPRHPDIGLPQPDEATLAEMEALATSA